MARRRYKDNGDSIWGFVLGVGLLYILWLVVLYLSDRAAYWRQFWYFVAFLVVVFGGTFAWREFRYRRKQKKLDNLLNSLKQNKDNLLNSLKQSGLENYVKNFINRFGMQKGEKGDWAYRGHTFDWERLRDFRKFLNEKGLHLSLDKWDDTSFLLRYYIQQKEERLTRESINLRPKKFSDLSGPEFENLLCRLFEAMGYAVQKTGKVGDQGGDLVANKGGERILIQAKNWNKNIRNDAVQQAVAAQKFYDCNRIMVATNSSFTREAIELAKVNNVELIGGGKLSELLLRYLKESWG